MDVAPLRSAAALDRICELGTVLEAWADEPWINDSSAVRVSLVCSGAGDGPRLDGAPVSAIHADLKAPNEAGDGFNPTLARRLPENAGASFQDASKKAKFEIAAALARAWLRLPNPNGRPNADGLKPCPTAR